MDIQELRSSLKIKDIEILLDDSKKNLRVLGKLQELTAADKADLTNNKQEIIAFLLLEEEGAKYWTEQFKGELPLLEIPVFKSRSKVQEYRKEQLTHHFSAGLSKAIKDLSPDLFTGILSGITAVLYRYTGQDDFILDIGNAVFIRTFLQQQQRFDALLKEQAALLLTTKKYETSLQHSDLSGVAGVCRAMISLEGHTGDSPENKYDLCFIISEVNECISLHVMYNRDLIEPSGVEKILLHCERLFTVVSAQPDIIIDEIDILTAPEKEQLLGTFNMTTIEYPRDKSIADYFEAQVEKTPDSIALVFEERELSYRVLNEEANRLAHFLRDTCLTRPGDLIGIKLGRSERLLVAILGILKAGAAYVPIDVNYPKERVAYIEKEINARVVIDEQTFAGFVEQRSQYPITNLPAVKADGLAYIIYTSGTTGLPKGVMVEHRSVISLCECYRQQFGLGKMDIALMQLASVSFDVFVGDICKSLLLGGKMVICPENIKLQPEALFKLMHKHNVSVMEGTPVLLLALTDHILKNKLDYSFLKMLIFGADSFNNQDFVKVRKSMCSVRVLNTYGVTETTVDSTLYDDMSEDFQGTTPIGKPYANTRIYILQGTNTMSPIGVYGKIYIAGDAVTRGYLNKEELTRQKFIADPFFAGQMMYDSGDLARWLPDGNIEFKGRNDFQVKVRGYRVELGEIESRLLLYSADMKKAVVIAKEISGQQALVAYYVSQGVIDKAELRAFLLRRLPEYMVPNFYVAMKDIPLTPNGKIDRKSLPDVTPEDFIRREYVAPGNEMERKLVAIWADVLGQQKADIGVNANFFEIGGTSLTVIRLVTEMNSGLLLEGDKEISPVTIFEYTNIRDLATYLMQDADAGNALNEKIEESMSVLDETLSLIGQYND